MPSRTVVFVAACSLAICATLHAQEAPPAQPPPPPAEQSAPTAPAPARVGGTVKAAKMIRHVRPVYPEIARQRHVTGTVVLHATIAKDGSVHDVTVVSGSPLLCDAAVDAVKQWLYEPTRFQGELVEVKTTISAVFSLDKKTRSQ
jgi:protein TonB